MEKEICEQIRLLREVVHSSPYLSRQSREQLEQEISELDALLQASEQHASWEKRLLEVNARAAIDEVHTVFTKINHLNPSSPRLSEIREIASRLDGGEITPDESRQELQRLMHRQFD